MIEIEGNHKSENRVAIPNMEDNAKPERETTMNDIDPTDPQHIDQLSTKEEPTLDDLIENEYKHTVKLQTSQGRFAESRWLPYLDVEHDNKLEDETDDSPITLTSREPLWFTTQAEQRDIEKRRKLDDRDERRKRR